VALRCFWLKIPRALRRCHHRFRSSPFVTDAAPLRSLPQPFHGWPARELTMVGVTGTNGKTTTVGLLRHLLHREERPAASIGTLGVLVGSAGTEVPGGQGLTTPGPVELQRLLRQLRDRGVRTVAMEVSSHSLDQRRVEGIVFAAAVFTKPYA
jgi:UDP-N-acetylmuramoyl-L-alanyl-D-glutamate--2,6-diaminopimelate ligase